MSGRCECVIRVGRDRKYYNVDNNQELVEIVKSYDKIRPNHTYRSLSTCQDGKFLLSSNQANQFCAIGSFFAAGGVVGGMIGCFSASLEVGFGVFGSLCGCAIVTCCAPELTECAASRRRKGLIEKIEKIFDENYQNFPNINIVPKDALVVEIHANNQSNESREEFVEPLLNS